MNHAESISETTLSAALPDTTSTFKLRGLTAPVLIYRDEWGIPHIKARNEHDVFFAQGFATAQDRLFQMDYDRLRCLGRWAEYAGDTAIKNDILMRRRKLGRAARNDYEATNGPVRDMMDAYAAGVNAFLRTTQSLPIEYSLLKSEPEPWEPWHCVAVYKIRNTAEGTYMNKIWLSHLCAEIGAKNAAELMPGYLPGQLLTIPPGSVYEGAIENALHELNESAKLACMNLSPDGESNAWAISGERTASGLPLIAGDSHRVLDTPNVYMQVHLFSPTLSVLGYTIPGWPGVLHFCHNESVAWGMTHGRAETQDIFAERLRNTSDRKEYLFLGEWRTVASTRETIKSRGGGGREIVTMETHHGQIISGETEEGYGFALADPGAQTTHWISSAYRAMKAEGADDLESALDGWTDRVNNYLYADVNGEFGYRFAGLVPVRSRAHAFGPAPGWTGEHEWRGFIPPSELPRTRNPKEGWIVTCNQRVVDETYPYFLSNWWSSDYRARRIAHRIDEVSGQPATPADMADIHGESLSIPAESLLAMLANLDHIAFDRKTNLALEILRSWDTRMNADSNGAAIYAALSEEIIATVVRRRFGILAESALSGRSLSGLDHIHRFIRPMIFSQMRYNQTHILGEGMTWQTLIAEAMPQALRTLSRRLGSNPSRWRWGDLHVTRHTHPLSEIFPSASSSLNPPAVPTHGDNDTPLAGLHLLDFVNAVASVNRYIFNPSDWTTGRWVVPLGASGHPGNSHYIDQQALWANIETIPQLWDWHTIQKKSESVQCLEPYI